MNIVFRADAGSDMGIGHVMRCLTLADELSRRGHACRFVSRAHEGNIARHVAGRGYSVALLPLHPGQTGWLGARQGDDAAETMLAIADGKPDWVVTDHYGIGASWEGVLRGAGARLLAIDDLADRPHDCDILLDQTLGRDAGEYRHLVPGHAVLLVGAAMALLGPRFAALRGAAPPLRERSERLLVTMGGADPANLTAQVLDAIDDCTWQTPIAVDVVLGAANPWIDAVRERAARSRWPMQVLVDVRNMAELMLAADLAIGAAGTTSWERCCLGLPSVLVVAAENQRRVASALAEAGAAEVLPDGGGLRQMLGDALGGLARDPARLAAMSARAAALVDGQGCVRVANAMGA